MNKKSKLIFLISLFIVGCEKVEDPVLLSHIVPGDFIDDEFVFPMNTITTLRMYYKSQYEQVVNEFDNIVISLSKEVDRYHDYEQINNLKTINDSCGSDTFVNVSDELFELIKLSIDITKLSEGKFNLAMGNIIDLYSSKISEELSGREDTLFEQELINQYVANIPSYEIIDEVIELDYENKAVKLNKYNENNVIISLGAIAKGFVMQKAYDYLKEFNYPALFDAGSSTMATIGQKPS
ncbi:MAG: FAD:protein FMN transferase, partial [Bacilli bacterium]|nr:FAD:protein FMN transferase [Bacilli bacterium]